MLIPNFAFVGIVDLLCSVFTQVGVEHLLRDINDPSVSTLANRVWFALVIV